MIFSILQNLKEINKIILARIYGFVVYDKGSPLKRMMVEVTGIGQVRQPYGVFEPNAKTWGINFNPSTETGG